MAIWLNTHDAALKAHVGAGKLSFAGMAAAINGEFRTDFSRNAAIGRAHRLGLVAKRDPGAEPRAPRAPREKRSTANTGMHRTITRVKRANGNSGAMRVFNALETAQPELRCVEIVPLHLSFDDLGPADCHYPYGRDEKGDDAPVTYCGHPNMPGSSYCMPHKTLCAGQNTTAPRAVAYIGAAA